MHILVVAATAMEVAPIVRRLRPESVSASPPRLTRYGHAEHQIDILLTGVGMVATAAWCSRALAKTRYDLGLNLGLCGSFDRALAVGSVVQVVSDRIAELGAEDDEVFVSFDELGLPGDAVDVVGGCAFSRAELMNPAPPESSALNRLPAVKGITVNTVHGNQQSIASVVRRFQPQVESMEGAAFMYACMIHGLAFAQVRAVSNVVERRNRAAWRVADAVENLGVAAIAILETV
jgi:futalosine hydrolase